MQTKPMQAEVWGGSGAEEDSGTQTSWKEVLALAAGGLTWHLYGESDPEKAACT